MEYLSGEQTTQIKDLRSELKDGKLTDKDYYSKLESLLEVGFSSDAGFSKSVKVKDDEEVSSSS